MPDSVPRDQLQCFPDPLMPAKGFSWRSTLNPCLSAVVFIRAMSSRLWSMARLACSKTGAISNWFGATSLCLVLMGIPSLYAPNSRSFMNSRTLSGMHPK